MATPLHNHTYYSAYDGLSKPIEIANRVAELGYSACACTDHDLVSGHPEFHSILSGKGIKPILGIETYQSPISRFENYKALRDKETGWRIDNFHLILFAMNEEGLRNLYRMNSEAHGTGFYYNARVDWDLLRRYNRGIIATSACGLGMIQQALQGNRSAGDPEQILQQYLSIFGDRFYLELSTYPAEWQQKSNVDTVSLANLFGIPLVYGNDAHYAYPDQYTLHEVIMAMQVQKKLKDITEATFEQALYIMDEKDIRDHLHYLPASKVDEAIGNSDVIAGLCNTTLDYHRKRVPIVVADRGYRTTREMMLDLVEKGYERKIVAGGKDESVYWPRLEKELGVLFGANLIDYLLMVRDYVVWARREGIMVGPGRGSIGGSLVAYLIDIADVDPIRYGLIFERFYNIGREKSLPDIDIDFSKEGRDRVKEYVTQKYGSEYVADVGTVIQLHPKSAINDLARVMSIPMKEAQTITKILDKAIDAGLQASWPTILEKFGEELQPWLEKYPQLFEWAMDLSQTDDKLKDDQVKTYGVHPSGVIVGDEPLADIYPLRWVTKDKKLVTQWDMRIAEKLGFIKADLLGLRNLDTLTELNRILIATERDPIDFDSLQDVDHPEEMWQLMDKGLTVGLFQIEDGGSAKQISKAMRPRSVDDLAVINAMNRPGPLRSKDAQGRSAFERYMIGRSGGVVDYLNPVVEQATSETYGIFLYQEQIINFMTLIGYSSIRG
jgi:DNA polymerase-3 subunit alpha